MKLTHGLLEKSLILFLVVGLFSGLSVMSVHGVTRNQLTIANLDTSQFPNISLFFWAFDSTGSFVKDIQGSELHILENETVIAASSLEMLEPGVRFITVINEGPTLANRYAMVARIDKIKEALLAWAQVQPATTMDDFSLVNNQGAIAYNQVNPVDWQETINNYLPNMRQATPGLAGLSAALDQAISSSGPTRKTPAILYITPMPEDSQVDGLRDLISRAVTSGVRLFIWLVGPQDYATSQTATLLMQAAEDTNGEFLVFSGAEELPQISSYLDPLKYVYQLTYKSAVKTGGDQTLKLQVRRQSVVLDSAEVSFPLTVAAPNPIFLSPPASLTRTWVETDKRNEYVLTPEVVEIAYLLEFPDGHPRDLSYARLLVDGKLAVEDTALPFDSFAWDISEIQTSGSYQLQVVVQDVVGLQGETIEIPMDIVVDEKPLTGLQRLTARFSLLTVIPIALVAGAAVLILLIGWKTVKKNLAVRSARSHRLQDPVTQPVEISGEPVILAHKAESPDTWPRIPGDGPALARLLLLASGKPGTPEKHEIPIGEFGITLGSDATRAKVLLNYPLVSPMHARIFMDEEKKFRVADVNSAAGTWLNYAPVSSRGAHLEHGDVLQFGRASFRFEQLGMETKKLRVVRLPDEE
jgi:hypothetical protein